MPCIFICQIWQLYPSQQRKYFSSTLNKYPRTGERNPWGCREKQEYLNRQEHGKLSSSSCLKQLEGRGDDNPWETQPKHVFFSRPNPSKLQEISASFTVLPKDTILNVAGHARDVVWDAAQCRFSQSYYKEVVMKQNESVWLKSAVLTQNISFFFFFSKIFLMCGTSMANQLYYPWFLNQFFFFSFCRKFRCFFLSNPLCIPHINNYFQNLGE